MSGLKLMFGLLEFCRSSCEYRDTGGTVAHTNVLILENIVFFINIVTSEKILHSE